MNKLRRLLAYFLLIAILGLLTMGFQPMYLYVWGYEWFWLPSFHLGRNTLEWIQNYFWILTRSNKNYSIRQEYAYGCGSCENPNNKIYKLFAEDAQGNLVFSQAFSYNDYQSHKHKFLVSVSTRRPLKRYENLSFSFYQSKRTHGMADIPVEPKTLFVFLILAFFSSLAQSIFGCLQPSQPNHWELLVWIRDRTLYRQMIYPIYKLVVPFALIFPTYLGQGTGYYPTRYFSFYQKPRYFLRILGNRAHYRSLDDTRYIVVTQSNTQYSTIYPRLEIVFILEFNNTKVLEDQITRLLLLKKIWLWTSLNYEYFGILVTILMNSAVRA